MEKAVTEVNRSMSTTPIDGSVIARAQAGTKNDVDLACRTAKENRGIRELPGSERIEIFECAAEMLEKHRNEFIRVLQIEAGKTALDAEGEFDSALQRFRFTKEEASRIFGEYIPGDWNKGTTEKMAMVIREPVGVVAAIIPFNYPLFTAATKIAPGLLAGNSVVLKPSQHQSHSIYPAGKSSPDCGSAGWQHKPDNGHWI